MDQYQFEKNLEIIHQKFTLGRSEINALSGGVRRSGEAQDVLHALLDQLSLPKNNETRYIAYERIALKKFEPLKIYLQRE